MLVSKTIFGEQPANLETTVGQTIIKIDYFDFIELLKISPADEWMPFTEIQLKGIYRVNPPKDTFLSPEELRVLLEHPTGNYEEPILQFPAYFADFKQFDEA